jgi:hypothetical protein
MLALYNGFYYVFKMLIPSMNCYNALFGCTEMISGIELSDNSKFNVERKWVTIQILLFGWLGI